jgi:hypothetical protein
MFRWSLWLLIVPPTLIRAGEQVKPVLEPLALFPFGRQINEALHHGRLEP